MQIYCLKCKEKVEVKSPKKLTNERGMDYATGKCPDCGGKVSVILGKHGESKSPGKAVKRNPSEKEHMDQYRSLYPHDARKLDGDIAHAYYDGYAQCAKDSSEGRVRSAKWVTDRANDYTIPENHQVSRSVKSKRSKAKFAYDPFDPLSK